VFAAKLPQTAVPCLLFSLLFAANLQQKFPSLCRIVALAFDRQQDIMSSECGDLTGAAQRMQASTARQPRSVGEGAEGFSTLPILPVPRRVSGAAIRASGIIGRIGLSGRARLRRAGVSVELVPMREFLKSLAIQRRVIGALIMRETYTRYGRDDFGFAWMFGEFLVFALPAPLPS
jgi:hypothetical protein